jgi:hypothetical protein
MLQIILCIELEKLIFHKKELRLIFLFKFNHMILLDILKLFLPQPSKKNKIPYFILSCRGLILIIPHGLTTLFSP